MLIDFDAVYRLVIAPAIDAAGMDAIRADEELVGGIIHKPMYERLILCEYAVADLTTANANVFYELGVRHAVRPSATVLMFAGNSRLPFDVAPLRVLPYALAADGTPDQAGSASAALRGRLIAAKEQGAKDSPIFQLIENFPDIQRLKTDVFRERVEYGAKIKERLAVARKEGLAAVSALATELQPIAEQEAGVIIDLFLSYRATKGWQEMVALFGKMSAPLAATVMVQEQYALALNRAGDGERAEQVLLDLLERRGPSSETFGILGRVYKDRWEAAVRSNQSVLARGLLTKAITAYLRGFEADWRDAYPGVNAVTLMTLQELPDPRREKLLPVVAYAVERRIAGGKPDYWDFATRLELAILGQDQNAAEAAIGDALAARREIWEGETTARNLRLIREARERRGTSAPWMQPLEDALVT
jgi:hypothetical protein